MAKRHITIRIEEGVADALDQMAESEGVSRSEAAERLIRASLCEPAEAGQRADKEEGGPEVQGDSLRAVLEVLRASNADLRAEVSRLWSQLAEKDLQIERAHDLADQAHRLHAAEVTRALPDGRTLRERIKSLFGRTS